MYYVQNAFAIKDSLKAAGGKWVPDSKAWAFSDETFSKIAAQIKKPAKVIYVQETPREVVPFVAGETFSLVGFSAASATTAITTVCAMTERGAVAIWTRTEVTRARGLACGRTDLTKKPPVFISPP